MKFLEVPGLGQVSRVGLGTWQFGSREWGYGQGYASEVALKIVARARELGVTLFDTAEVYGFGKSERILGEALGAERGEVVVASKVFPVAPFPSWSGTANAAAPVGCSFAVSRSIRCTNRTPWCPTR
jgi:aryl-alcohol dehydrogenase-like predicted oxidoreductase